MAEDKTDARKIAIWIVAVILLLIVLEAVVNGVRGGASIEPGQPTLIQFYSDNCVACTAMQPVMDEVMRECDGRGIRIERMNVRDPNIQRLARRFGVYGVPTFIFFNSKGREYTRLMGVQPRDRIRKVVRKLTDGRCGYSTDS